VTIDDLETPAVVVDLDVLSSNLRRLAVYALEHALQVRPHTKTHKIPAIARMQTDSGCHGITVAKSGEAEVMAAAGLNNILIAYPIFGEGKLKRLAALAMARTITVAVDNLVTAEAISLAAEATGAVIRLLVEIDVGMRRCGVGSPEEAVRLALAIEYLPNVRFRRHRPLSRTHLGSSRWAMRRDAQGVGETQQRPRLPLAQRPQLRGGKRREHTGSLPESLDRRASPKFVPARTCSMIAIRQAWARVTFPAARYASW
jgi:hypothetical protein